MIKIQYVVHIEFKYPAGADFMVINADLNDSVYPMPYAVDIFTRYPQKDHIIKIPVQSQEDAFKVDVALKQVLMRRGCKILGEGDRFTYYLTRDDRGLVELRQSRYRFLWENETPHPHDVCAVAGSKNQMRQMLTGWDSASIDWAPIPEDE